MSRDHWFEDLADHMGEAYLRYSFTKGTEQEIDHITEALSLNPGDRVLDVGCGPGRHAHALARRGIEVHGIDISQRFVDIARRTAASDSLGNATFERLDARSLAFDDEFDTVICLCQGAFGLMTADGEDAVVIDGMARALRPGGRMALSAFSAYFVVKHWNDDPTASFDVQAGVNHERTDIRSETGDVKEVDLWTGCYTPRELRLLCNARGVRVDSISGVEPGHYGHDAPTADTAEFLVIGTKQ